jgi:hypothetical protein
VFRVNLGILSQWTLTNRQLQWNSSNNACAFIYLFFESDASDGKKGVWNYTNDFSVKALPRIIFQGPPAPTLNEEAAFLGVVWSPPPPV